MSAATRVRRAPGTDRPNNRLLRALSEDNFRELAPHLNKIAVRTKREIFTDGDPIRRVFFPNGGVWSVIAPLATGAMIEVAMIGDEGMLGLEAVLGDTPVALGTTLLQVPDSSGPETTAMALDVDVFRRALLAMPVLHALIAQYAHLVVAQVLQATACNAHHDVQQRCARWLLTTHDRVHGRDFRLSHEFLAMMLGVRRQTVSEVAGALQAAGMLQYVHGHVRVLDRMRLEAAACECYSTIRARFDRLP